MRKTLLAAIIAATALVPPVALAQDRGDRGNRRGGEARSPSGEVRQNRPEWRQRAETPADRTALIAANVPQCGYCIPGIVMAASVLLRANRAPSEQDIKDAIPNICRCGIYPRLIGAIQQAGRIVRGDAALDAIEGVQATAPQP